MLYARPLWSDPGVVPAVVTIRREDTGYGIRFGLTEAEDALMRGPMFATLEEAFAWVDAADNARSGSSRPDVAGPSLQSQADSVCA